MKSKTYRCFVVITILLTGCITNNPKTPNVPSTTTSTSAPTIFEQRHILALEGKVLALPFSSDQSIVEVSITNNSDQELKEIYFDFTEEQLYLQGQLSQLGANETKKILVLARGSSQSPTHRYNYQTQESSIGVDLVTEHIEYYQLSNDLSSPQLPQIPNSGVTVFAWQDQDTWRFDYAMGTEMKEEDQNSYYILNQTLIESLLQYNVYQEEEHDTYFYIINKEGSMSEEIKSYIKAQMAIFDHYQTITYVMEGEEDKFATLDQQFPYKETIGLYTKAYSECKLTLCADRYGIYQSSYAFPDEVVSTIGTKQYSIDEITQILTKYRTTLPFLNVYVKGKSKELQHDDHGILTKLFSDRNIYVEMENLEVIGAMKPVIYLYPEEEIEIWVTLDYHGTLNTTYPDYGQGWHVLAKPDGTLTNQSDGIVHQSLFWEGTGQAYYPMDEGFVVAKQQMVAFLQDKLSYLGLNQKEINEFIVFWLPLLNENPYNVIAFQTDAYTTNATLHVIPTPDTEIRVYMTYYGITTPIAIPAQTLTKQTRKGYTLVEWGGSKVTQK